jgi:phosphate starvation-inducible protein PhoH and related proteins
VTSNGIPFFTLKISINISERPLNKESKLTKRAKRSTKQQNPREDRNSNFTNRGFNSHPGQHRHSPRMEPGFDPRFRDEQPEFMYSKASKTRVELIPRNIAQERYLNALTDDDKYIVFAMGPAGTGKTLLATQYAIKSLKEGNIKKIIITRPAVSVDEQHGFLPGSLIEKMAPWVIPIMDVFKEYYHPSQIEKMLKDEVIEIAPLAYMRGRTMKNAIVLFDEAQNATPNQMKMLLTRIGDNSKFVITGDIHQHDRGFEQNGLKDFVERLEARDSDSIGIIHFDKQDVERHPVIEEILDIYGTDE